jgi:hypothetical protein
VPCLLYSVMGAYMYCWPFTFMKQMSLSFKVNLWSYL